jgi:pimeloyl-ACP methyl ester carboxylesterase
MLRKTLLLCGVFSSVFYVAMNIYVAAHAEGYSAISQTVSELSAIDAPTRALWMPLGFLYGVLVLAFGFGIWLSSGRNRCLRVAGALLIAYAVFGFFWPPMHLRPVLAGGGGTLSDTLHIAWTFVSGVLMMTAIGFAATAFGQRFRAYSIGTIVLLIGFGVVTGMDAPNLQANLPTPWIGLWERIDMSFGLLWVVVLAVGLLRRQDSVAVSGRTPAFRTPTGEILPGSIAEAGYRRLGGLDQWVMIRGENVANPPLICLHGGPGFSETWLLRHFNAVLEKSFTVVYWDQRGAGKSFNPKIPRSSMTVEQFIADLDELVDAVRARLGQTRVAIFGHSWGSALGPLYAARFPEKVSAYIGGAQIGDSQAGESASYAYAVGKAQHSDNKKALKKLRAIGPPPYPAASVFTERTWVQRLDGQMRPRELWNMGRIVLGGPESSIFDLLDLPKTMRGFRFSLDALWPEVSTLNLLKRVPTLKMPVFFFLGRRDHWVPPETSIAYFDALIAPSKELVWFEQSGHEMFADEPDKFNQTMVALVRPVAAARPYNAPHEEGPHSPGARDIARAVA